jgi:dihydroorotate dehydrogenase (NAD+) catalytic subunit
VKLTPNVSDPSPVAVAAEDGGADAVSLINTLRARAVDPATGEPWLGGGGGGLSGAAVLAVAVAEVSAVSGAVSIPVIGMGGIATGRDAHDLISAGAKLVAVGTESFRDPAAGTRIAAELGELMQIATTR